MASSHLRERKISGEMTKLPKGLALAGFVLGFIGLILFYALPDFDLYSVCLPYFCFYIPPEMGRRFLLEWIAASSLIQGGLIAYVGFFLGSLILRIKRRRGQGVRPGTLDD